MKATITFWTSRIVRSGYMRLLSFDPLLYTPEFEALSDNSWAADNEICLFTTSEGLRLLRSGIREANEELRGDAFAERVGTLRENAMELLSCLRKISVEFASREHEDAVADGQFFWTFDEPLPTSRGALHSTPLSTGQILLAIEPMEVSWCIAALTASLEELEDWELETRFGFTETEVELAISQLDNVRHRKSA
ncbi:hypothetical protein ACXR2T_09380 [Leucobacter sp. HY1910]